VTGGGLTPVAKTFANTGDTLVVGTMVLIDSSGGAPTFNLPAAPSVGDRIQVQDSTASFVGHNVTLSRNGLNIMSVAQDLLLDVNNLVADLYYASVAVGWKIITP